MLMGEMGLGNSPRKKKLNGKRSPDMFLAVNIDTKYRVCILD